MVVPPSIVYIVLCIALCRGGCIGYRGGAGGGGESGTRELGSRERPRAKREREREMVESRGAFAMC